MRDDNFLSTNTPEGICVWQNTGLMGTVGARGGSVIRVLLAAHCSQVVDCSSEDGHPKERRVRVAVRLVADDALDMAWCLYARMRHLVLLHGAVLEKDGQGVLIVGESGAGKTTMALTLLRAGFRLLSDEYAVLWKKGACQGQMSGILVPPMIVGSELSSLADLEKTLGYRSEHKAPSAGVVASRKPEPVNVRTAIALKSPKQRSTEHQASPLAPMEVFPILMGQLLDPVHSDRMGIVEALSEFTFGVSAYRMTAGTDLGSLPEFVEGLMVKKRHEVESR